MDFWNDAAVDAQAIEYLRAASDLLDKAGWCQYIGSDAEGHHCTVNAVHQVGMNMERPGRNLRWASVLVARQAVVYIARSLGFLTEDGDAAAVFVAKWNDQPERTVEDVKLQYKRAIELIESELERQHV